MGTATEQSGSTPQPRPRKILQPEDIRGLIVFTIVILVIVPACAVFFGGLGNEKDISWRIGLDTAAFAAAPLATQTHAIFILTMVVTGWGMLALPKGDRRHRLMGWTWVSAMTLMGLSSMLVPHGDSWVAAYGGGGSALVLMAYGIYKIKRRRYRDHAKTMVMLMIALVVMTLLAVLPGRMMHTVLFSG